MARGTLEGSQRGRRWMVVTSGYVHDGAALAGKQHQGPAGWVQIVEGMLQLVVDLSSRVEARQIEVALTEGGGRRQ